MRTEQKDLHKQEKEANEFRKLQQSREEEEKLFTLWELFCVETGVF